MIDTRGMTQSQYYSALSKQKVRRVPHMFKKANRYRRYLGNGVYSDWWIERRKEKSK